jgi:hypothetical protein
MRDLVCEERDPHLFHHLGVPPSTAVSWIRRGPRPVVSADVLAMDGAELQAEVLGLRRRIRLLLAIVRLAFLLVRLSGFRLDSQRVPQGETKRSILAAIASAQKAIPLALDNFSRRILAWKIALHLEPNTTCKLLAEAAKHLPAGSDATSVVADSGVENVNEEVNALFDIGPLRRVLAQVEVSFSNSMIEAFWRSLKHQWLYLNSLDSIERLRTLVEFYVEQHNTQMPHAAFSGQTPDEMYFGTAAQLPTELAAARDLARAARLAANRGLSCDRCLGEQATPAESEIPP